jgi:UMF1 family MFS transporter
MSKGYAVRLSMLTAAIWWAAFTLIPFLKLRNRPAQHTVAVEGSLFHRSFGQLATTFREMRNYPMTMTFLLAYLFYNDGIQTVINSASTFGVEELDLGEEVLIATILLVQFVAFGGALLFGRLAQRYGAYRLILAGTGLWMLIVVAAFFLPVGKAGPFLALAVGIGIVMGGTQALSRSFFSLLIPRGREGEYFSLYQACERGTSWFGALLFALMFQLTGSYRPSIVALIVFFLLGGFFLLRLDPQRGIREAGNTTPSVL